MAERPLSDRPSIFHRTGPIRDTPETPKKTKATFYLPPTTIKHLKAESRKPGLVGFGNAHEHPDHLHRNLGGEIPHEVEAFPANQRLSGSCAEIANQRFDRGDPLRGEHPRHEGSVHRVLRRILVDEQSGWHWQIHHADQPTLGRGKGVPVAQDPFHVIEAAHQVEVVPIVVVERGLIAKTLVHLIRIGVDLPVVRVVVNGGGRSNAQDAPPRTLVGPLKVRVTTNWMPLTLTDS